ncbi:phenylacetate-CoA oxygenase subunit PaaJ [Streptomyces enissocaesilis]|uniref:1,2-phenylacetyl-CoA epoxidase subunit PaaD n=2 Tax=Streptomyces rochei TaxID=1928 RepID=A0ABW7DYE8_STRRO|nr:MULTISPECIES: 1,2-phenylacetyl-CoA epoxidase subunit PaaD [unclassified Streptomyces]MDI3101655.1 phenylacetate-CoA oxygenase subunit PaaJ [Streptomyces sp. AN-3]WDI16276.1 phenylacetate-CoA oxygenase subunit PaaJ [Streptomyces enissocaesilis]
MSGWEPPTPRRSAREVRERVRALPDPELPVIGLGDLGVVGSVAPGADGVLEVEITPTYLGCPALAEITAAVRDVLTACGHPDGRVRQVLSPPWTTDRITPEGRRKLAAHGIAPPVTPAPDGPVPVGLGDVPCPHCGARATRPHSPFGPSRCQSVWWCTGCREPFPHVTAL